MFVAVDSELLIQRVATLARQIWEEHYPDIIGMEQVQYMLQKIQSIEAIRNQIEDGMEYYLLVQNDEDVGYFSVRLEENGLFLSKLYIKATETGGGLGTRALDFMRKNWQADRVWLTVNRENSESIRFYQNRGFVKTREVVKDIGGGFIMDDFLMEWS